MLQIQHSDHQILEMTTKKYNINQNKQTFIQIIKEKWQWWLIKRKLKTSMHFHVRWLIQIVDCLFFSLDQNIVQMKRLWTLKYCVEIMSGNYLFKETLLLINLIPLKMLPARLNESISTSQDCQFHGAKQKKLH